ncbi:DUF6927 domain-containing protein [Sphingorhabdus buctiana]|uniref:DUF6927 domain-containing protein n=1 Tax=Sphingorhabdus buctiana TaxID=1508805 RepID=A0ABW4M8W2_9SPHN|nr:hypothetical protein [Sphingopyxis sp.]
MGWLSMTAAGMGGHKRPKAYLDAQLTFAPDPAKDRPTGLRVLRSSMVGQVYYAAVENYDADSSKSVFAVVCLTRWNPKARDGYIFAYKDMDESCGPNECQCPARILDLLTEPANDYAREWRARCWARLLLTGRKQPQSGDRLIFPEPIRFTDGYEGREFEVVRRQRAILLQRPDARVLYKLSRLMERRWSLVPGSTTKQ